LRAGKKPIYGKATNKRILALLEKPPPQGYARGRVLCWPRHWATLMFSMSGASCASTVSTLPPANPGARATIPRSRRKPPMWSEAIVLCVDEKPSIQALERAQGYLKLPNGRALTGHSHDYRRHGTTTLFAA